LDPSTSTVTLVSISNKSGRHCHCTPEINFQARKAIGEGRQRRGNNKVVTKSELVVKGGLVRVPDSETDAKNGGESLYSLVKVGQFFRSESEGQTDYSGHQKHSDDRAKTKSPHVQEAYPW